MRDIVNEWANPSVVDRGDAWFSWNMSDFICSDKGNKK
jgi:hypothetical protein